MRNRWLMGPIHSHFLGVQRVAIEPAQRSDMFKRSRPMTVQPCRVGHARLRGPACSTENGDVLLRQRALYAEGEIPFQRLNALEKVGRSL